MSDNLSVSLHTAFEAILILTILSAYAETVFFLVRLKRLQQQRPHAAIRLFAAALAYGFILMLSYLPCAPLGDDVTLVRNTILGDVVVLLGLSLPASVWLCRLRYSSVALGPWILGTQRRTRIDLGGKRSTAEIIGLFLFCIAFSVVPFLFAPWRYAALGHFLASLAESYPAGTVWYTARAGLIEELVFRGYLLPRFEYLLLSLGVGKKAWPTAVIISSAAFAIGHTLLLEPAYLKISQAFFLGVVLAYVARRQGLETVAAFHALFNVVAVILSFVFPHYQ
ncbi:MAG: CPBP family intramembrane metalloprotease [Candidatus Sumerlaeaceae bacterium]|nr:CPBP family intramembrane metalloprotease [Candidatus Sumerlaeaceae bacterium]